MAEEFTAKFKVDISDLKKNLKEANKEIKLANATFKNQTAGMENWAKSTDGLSAKLEQLEKILQQEKSKLSSYQEQLEKQKTAYEENGKRADQLKDKLKDLADSGVSKTSEEYKKYETALKECIKEQQNNEKAIDDLNVKILDQETKVKKTEAEIGKYETSLEELEKEQEEAKKTAEKQETAYGKLKKEIEDQQDELDDLKEKYADAVIAQGKDSDAAKDLADQIDKLSGELAENKSALKDADDAADDLDNSLEEVQEQAEKSSDGFTVMKGALADLVADGIRLCVDALKDFVTESINVGSSFDSAMSQVQAISGSTADDLAELRDKAKEMGASTKFTATESAEAFNYMAMAGWKTEDMLSGIDGILSLAAASGEDLATTSDIVTDALTAFGMGAEEAGHFSDVLAAASSNANTNVHMMGESFKYVAPVAGSLGYSVEDVSIALGLMANSGIKAGTAGASLRNILNNMAKPTKQSQAAMDRLGLSLYDSEGNMYSLREIMNQARDSFANINVDVDEYNKRLDQMDKDLEDGVLTQSKYEKELEELNLQTFGAEGAEKARAAAMLGGTRAMSALLAITNATTEDVDKLTNAVDNSAGAANDMADIMMDNLGGDMTKLQSHFEGVQIELYEKFAPTLREVVQSLNDVLDMVSNLIDEGVKFVAWLNSGTTGAEAFKVIIIALAAGFTALTTALLGMMIVSKVKEAFAAFNAVLAANPIVLIISLIAALVAAFIYLWNNCEEFREFWINLWETIKEIVGTVLEAIVGFFTEAWEAIKTVWSVVKEWFTDRWNDIKKVFSNVAQWFKQKFTQAYTNVKNAFSSIGSWFAGKWKAVKDALSGVATWFKTKFESAYTNVQNAFTNVGTWFKEKFDDAYTNVTNAFQNIGTYFSNRWKDTKEAFSTVKTWFGDKFSDAFQAIKDKFADWGSFWSGLWTDITGTFSTIGTNVANAISGAVKSGLNGVISLIENTINSGIGLINGAIDLINKLPGVSVSKVSTLALPRLAQGGILKKGQVGLLEGSGAEAVVPLSQNKQWIRAVANEMNEGINGRGSVIPGPGGTGGKVTNYTQNIYAPKQPSRIELYRQTRNLLALAEGRA